MLESDVRASATTVAELGQRVRENIARVVVGNDRAIEMLLVALLCEGHVLLEDVPGIGKTTLAKSAALSLDLTLRRVQCTPDLTPSDVTGVHFFDQRTSEFALRQGPIFTHILLADEINRATPRTQSALLEAMEERQVTIDGITLPLPRPFLVLATQNPVELEGTFPLPEAQLDRFLVRIALGYPTELEEDAMLERFSHAEPLATLAAVATHEELTAAMAAVTTTRVEPAVRRYALQIVRATRGHPSLALGVSPRGALALFRTSRALAALRGRDYVLPDDVKELVQPVLAHRCMLSSQSRIRGHGVDDALESIVAEVPVPLGL